jgi:uncharacterized surface protein with fasciclin (FAS1) repeats
LEYPKFSCDHNAPFETPTPTVLKAGIPIGNGVIHLIDRVISPDP